MSQNGKGDSPRNCFSKEFRDGWDFAFKKKKLKNKKSNVNKSKRKTKNESTK